MTGFFDEESDTGLTPVVATFTGLDAKAPAQEPLEALERYKLVARLGHGGMAEVFLAASEVAPFVHRPVVIKRLHRHFLEDQQLVQMFVDEARLLCLLEHPHVVKTLEAGVIDGQCCIVMEYLEGQPLHRVLRRAYEQGQLPMELAASIASAVLEGLHYAHEATDSLGRPLEIVHRDVSPHNVFVTNEGQVLVHDFGIAKAKTQEGRTATGIVKGKVGYIAPEQAAAETVDRRADIWSTGVVLWEALTGERLFKGETDAATLNLTLKGEIPTAVTRRPGLPAALDVVLARALQRSPGLRYRTARDMHRDLEHWLTGSGAERGQLPLARLMQGLFATEIIEQRRLVSALMARSDCTPPTPVSARSPSSTSALVLSSPVTSAHLTQVSERVDALNARQRRAFRSVLLMLALFAGFTLGIAYLVVSRLRVPSGNVAAVALTPPPTPEPERSAEPVVQLPVSAPKVAAHGVLGVRRPAPPAPVIARPVAKLAPSAMLSTVAVSAPAVSAPAVEAAPSFGLLTIDTTPWSVVSVGGRNLGQTPLVGVKLPVGSQVLSLKNPELGVETTYTVTIEAGKTRVCRIGIE